MLLRRHKENKKEEVKVAEIVKEVVGDEVPENKEMEVKEDNQEIKELEEIPNENKTLEDLTVNELKDLLDEKSIEYNSKAKKEELIKLLEGAE